MKWFVAHLTQHGECSVELKILLKNVAGSRIPLKDFAMCQIWKSGTHEGWQFTLKKKGEFSFLKSRFCRKCGIWRLTKYALYAESSARFSCFVMIFWICWCQLPLVLCFQINYPYHKNPKSNANGPSYLRNEKKNSLKVYCRYRISMFIRAVKNEVICGSPDATWWVFSRAQNTFEKCCRFENTVERLCNVSGLKEWNACRLTIYAEKKFKLSFSQVEVLPKIWNMALHQVCFVRWELGKI